MENMLANIRESMEVYDRNHKRVGKVEFVRFGDEDPANPGPDTATPSAQPYTNPLMETIRDIFDPEELPETIRGHLLRYGFIRVEPGTLFGRDRFVAADQIAGVMDDHVMLKISAEEVAKPTE